MKKVAVLIFTIVILSCNDTTSTTGNACMEVSSSTVLVGQEISFTNCSKNVSYYFWNFGDLNTSLEVNPRHSYIRSGVYTVKLFAQDHEILDINMDGIIDENDMTEPYYDTEKTITVTKN